MVGAFKDYLEGFYTNKEKLFPENAQIQFVSRIVWFGDLIPIWKY